MNKLRSAIVIRADSREDGFVRTSNITKFLAVCSNYGVPNEKLFRRDDLIESTPDSLARVAKTIITLSQHVEGPILDRSKYLFGQAEGRSNSTEPPASQGGGASSTPN